MCEIRVEPAYTHGHYTNPQSHPNVTEALLPHIALVEPLVVPAPLPLPLPQPTPPTPPDSTYQSQIRRQAPNSNPSAAVCGLRTKQPRTIIKTVELLETLSSTSTATTLTTSMGKTPLPRNYCRLLDLKQAQPHRKCISGNFGQQQTKITEN